MKKIERVNEFLEILEGLTNIKTITWDTEDELFTITYKNGLKASVITADLLEDFLQNG